MYRKPCDVLIKALWYFIVDVARGRARKFICRVLLVILIAVPHREEEKVRRTPLQQAVNDAFFHHYVASHPTFYSNRANMVQGEMHASIDSIAAS